VARLLAAALLIAAFAAPAAQAAQGPETIVARTKFFGAANVDQATGAVRPDRLIMSWFGVTNFAVALRGHVVLFDAWVPRGPHSGYVPTTPEELGRLKPEAILLGHAHFDHAADAVPIALDSGATLAGTAEHCGHMRERSPGMPPRCVDVVAAGAPPGTTRAVELLSGVEIVAVKHLHSGAKSPNGDDAGGYHVPVTPLPSTTVAEHPPTPEDVAHLVEHSEDDEGGSVVYRFRVGGLSFVWNDTAGPLVEDAPETFDALRALRPVDMHVGAIQGFNQVTNGMRDVRRYIEAIAPKLFVPTHHDDWLVGITTKGAAYEPYLRSELELIPAEQRPQVRFIADPHDYVRPDVLTFPLELEPPRLVRRCVGAGRLRVSLRGELDLVRAVSFRLDGRRVRARRAAPFEVTFTRAQLGATRATRLRATVTLAEGSPVTLTRTLPRCGLR
jgi:L-ascorbate metabolism protein UlaG (beta-lactamase superfamily)